MDEVAASPSGIQLTSKDGSLSITLPLSNLESPPSSTSPVEDSTPEKLSSSDVVDGDAYNAILRLVVGGVLGASDLLAKQLKELGTERAAEKDQATLSVVDSGDQDQNWVRYAMVGLVFKSAETARKGANAAMHAADVVTRVGLAPIRALGRTWPFRPISRGFNNLAERGEKQLNQLAQIGRYEEERSLTTVEGTISSVMEEVPQASQINDLVETMVQNVIAYLQENPDIIQNIVRSQGGIYIDYLQENPEPIQNLVQGQTLDIAAELQEGMREQLVTGDNVLELFARSLFRRKPREELPEPPPEVKAKAIRKRIFIKEKPMKQE
jgi:hypothetical protein